MILEYSLTKEDLFNFQYYSGWANPDKKNYRIRYYLKTILAALIGALAIYFIRHHYDSLFLVLAILLGILVGTASAYFAIHVTYKNKLRRNANNPDNAGLFAKAELLINDQGITASDNRAESKINWNAIMKKVESSIVFICS